MTQRDLRVPIPWQGDLKGPRGPSSHRNQGSHRIPFQPSSLVMRRQEEPLEQPAETHKDTSVANAEEVSLPLGGAG